MNNDHDIKTLNNPIETTLDSSDGYAEAAKDARSAGLIALFAARARERRGTAATFRQCVRSLGGKPEDDGTVLASAHRVFVNLGASIASNDHIAVVDEVERGDDHIKAKFEDAMNDPDNRPVLPYIHQVAYVVQSWVSARHRSQAAKRTLASESSWAYAFRHPGWPRST